MKGEAEGGAAKAGEEGGSDGCNRARRSDEGKRKWQQMNQCNSTWGRP